MRILLYGCGDFSNVIESLSFIKQQLGDGELKLVAAEDEDEMDESSDEGDPDEVLATELRSETELRKVYGEVFTNNVKALGEAGVAVGFDTDATGHYSIGGFDLIVFRNPHTGTYGNTQDPGMSSYLESSTENQQLLMATLTNARKMLNPHGRVLITAVGWPYVGKNPKGALGLTGMQLEVPSFAAAYGKKAGLEHIRNLNLGQMWVARNRGSTFLAEEIGILYRI